MSTPANVAEGSDRGTDSELARFCDIASGSAAELDYYWRLSQDLGCLDRERAEALQSESRTLRVKLHHLARHLRAA